MPTKGRVINKVHNMSESRISSQRRLQPLKHNFSKCNLFINAHLLEQQCEPRLLVSSSRPSVQSLQRPVLTTLSVRTQTVECRPIFATATTMLVILVGKIPPISIATTYSNGASSSTSIITHTNCSAAPHSSEATSKKLHHDRRPLPQIHCSDALGHLALA